MLLTFRLCTKCRTYREIALFSKDKTRHDGLFPHCKLCKRQQDRAYGVKNSETIRRRVKEWRAANPERHRDGVRRRRAANLERFRRYATDWVKRNPGKANEALARRRVAEFNATPGWVDRRKIRAIYVEAARLTRETGIPHAVDHIVPLRSKLACGLHWHGNLQILTKSANSTKSNRYWPDMP